MLRIIFLFILLFLATGCSKKDENLSILKEKNLETQMIEVYNQAYKEFENMQGLWDYKF